MMRAIVLCASLGLVVASCGGTTESQPASDSTTWTILDKATGGALEGAQLEPLPHRNDFWFAWQALVPEAEVYEG